MELVTDYILAERYHEKFRVRPEARHPLSTDAGEDSEALGGFGPPVDVPAGVSVNGSHGTADKGQEGPP